MSSIVKVDTIQENTSANGITVDGLNIKDSKLVTADSVVTSNITNDAVTIDKLNLISTGSAPSLEAKGDGSSQDGYIQLNCSQNSHGIKLKSPAHSAGASYTLTFPPNDGDADQFLKTDGSGGLSFAAAGGDNTPSFGATMSADQNNLSDGTFTLAAFDTEVWDTDNAYTNTSSNYKFTVPSGEAGKYFITAHLMFRVDSSYQSKELRLNKNGSFLVENCHHLSTNEWRHNYSNNISITTVQNLSVGDYIQVYGKAVGNTWDMKQEGAYFSMHKLIGV